MLGLKINPFLLFNTLSALGRAGPGHQKKKSNVPLMRVWLPSEKGAVCG